MTCHDIHDQAEYDAHAGEGGACLHIVAGVVVLSSYASTVRASGSATVRASGSATVEAYDSATVRAYDSATVEASGSATVEAYGSATVRAYDSATVEAYDSATVEASDSATVEAYGSATVNAWGHVTVTAAPYVGVHRRSPDATITGGVIITPPKLQGGDPAEWAAYYGLPITDGHMVVFKAVDTTLTSAHGFVYQPGVTLAAPDWSPQAQCGEGLHFSPTPRHALTYYSCPDVRWLACRISMAETVTLGDKVKARTCEVLREVDRDGRPLATPDETKDGADHG